MLCGTLLGLACPGAGQEYSALWGRNGEAWDPAGRLPDVSYAGYACGERQLPKPAVVANVRNFGAKGDGRTDDTAAFLAALAKVDRGAVAVPGGRYLMSKILEINKPGVALRGAGPEQSVLVCPVPLNDIMPDWGATTSGQRTSNYPWSGGIVWFKGRNTGKRLGACPTLAKRGDHELRVQGDTAGLKSGGHFSELGFNAVAFNGVAHCWARNLVITNSDSGIFAGGRFCTIDGLRFQTREVKETG